MQTVDSLVIMPFDFNDVVYREYQEAIIDMGMGIDEEYLMGIAVELLLGYTDIHTVIDILDSTIFPEHVPNDALNAVIALCINYTNLVQQKLYNNVMSIKYPSLATVTVSTLPDSNIVAVALRY